MRILLSIALLFLTSVVAPTLALPNTPVVCDVARIKKHQVSNGGVTKISASSLAVAPGGTTTISLQGSFTGFMLYVRDTTNTHVGKLTPTGANVDASSPCNNGAPAGTTVGHNSATTKTAMSWTWTAPATAGTYQVVAMVAESAVSVPPPPVFLPTAVTITVRAAQPATQAPVPTQAPATQAPATQAPKPTNPPATQAPKPTNPPATKTNPTNPPATKPNPTDPPAATNPPPADTTTTTTTAAPVTGTTPATPTASPTIQQLLNTVLVRLQALLSGKGGVSVSQLKKLIQQIQTAVQKAKLAKGSPTATQPVQVAVTKATPTPTDPTNQVAAAAAAAGSSLYSLEIGFASQEDAQVFADSLTQAASLDSTVRGRSTLVDGDVTSQLQYDPAGLDAAGNVVVAAATVDLVTCPDGTLVTQDLAQVACAAADTTAPAPAAGAGAAGAGTTTTATTPMSNGMFIGLIIGGIAVLLLGVGGFVYYQKSKASNTVKPRV